MYRGLAGLTTDITLGNAGLAHLERGYSSLTVLWCCSAGGASAFSGGWFPRGWTGSGLSPYWQFPSSQVPGLVQKSSNQPSSVTHTSAAGHMLVPRGQLCLAVMPPWLCPTPPISGQTPPGRCVGVKTPLPQGFQRIPPAQSDS